MLKACLKVFIMFSFGAVIDEHTIISSTRHIIYPGRPLSYTLVYPLLEVLRCNEIPKDILLITKQLNGVRKIVR